jgi:hypothetical protein
LGVDFRCDWCRNTWISTFSFQLQMSMALIKSSDSVIDVFIFIPQLYPACGILSKALNLGFKWTWGVGDIWYIIKTIFQKRLLF